MNSGEREYFLTSARLGFGKWTLDDLPLAIQLWGSYEVTKHIDARGQLSKDQVLDKLKKEIETYKLYGVQYGPIFFLSNNEFAGCCGLRPYDLEKNIYEAGVHILPKHWRKGLASEALINLMEYAFTKLKISALFAGHNPNNTASESLLKKLGFRYTHDEYYPPTGLNHPSYLLTVEKNKKLL